MDCRSWRCYRINLADVRHAALRRSGTLGKVNGKPRLVSVNNQYDLPELRRKLGRPIEHTMSRSELPQGKLSLAKSQIHIDMR
jgi:hypothetical protein